MSETTKKKYPPRYRGHSRLMKSGNSGNLSVPSEMMSVLTDGLLFKPELTKDGILFKIVDEEKMIVEDKTVPAWVKKVTGTTSTDTSGNTGTTEPPLDTETDDAIVDEEPPIDDETPF